MILLTTAEILLLDRFAERAMAVWLETKIGQHCITSSISNYHFDYGDLVRKSYDIAFHMLAERLRRMSKDGHNERAEQLEEGL